MKSEILALLRETNDSVSGQFLCEHFHVSRTAVWKAINQLKEKGYEIEAVPNKGYRLISQTDGISAYEIKSCLHTKWIATDIRYKESTNSTNTDVKKLLEEGAKEGVLVVADEQVKGRGRRGRDWESPKGSTISMTLGLKPSFEPDQAPMLTLVNAMSVAAALNDLYDVHAQIKWPNDVVVNGKKICGILTEMSAETGFIHYVVIGTGINVRVDTFPEELKETATSLHQETEKSIMRAELIAKIMEYFEKYYEIFLETRDLSKLMQTYQMLLVNLDKQVRVLEPNGEYQGIAKGIDALGQLLVEKESGEVEVVYAGEVSVRGIYGYV